ncbi:hypothetical protein DPV74_41955, partial [Burkholderia sp. HAN2018]|nr:hypothetical protein [Burkholderia sp. HAN2018]
AGGRKRRLTGIRRAAHVHAHVACAGSSPVRCRAACMCGTGVAGGACAPYLRVKDLQGPL